MTSIQREKERRAATEISNEIHSVNTPDENHTNNANNNNKNISYERLILCQRSHSTQTYQTALQVWNWTISI